VRDVVRLGFEVRVILSEPDETTTWVQLTYEQAKQINPRVGQRFGVQKRAARVESADVKSTRERSL
jgi:hypothetical protein